MDAGDWIAVVAVLVGVGGLFYGRLQTKAGKRSADSSELSAGASVRAAVAGEESAKAAHEAARQAALISDLETDRRSEERERRHEDLAPQPVWVTEVEEHDDGRLSLFGWITVARSYRVQGVRRVGSTSFPLSLPLLLEAGVTHKIHIESFAPGQQVEQTETVQIRFWPPVAGVDEPSPWRCSCGRPETDDDSGHGHWGLTLQIDD